MTKMINLSVKLGRLKLNNPVLVASGTFGCGEEFKDQLEYCSHLRGRMRNNSVCSRQLMGITFAGAGMAVDVPADSGAVITAIEN